jgi:hypothetical protein
VRLVGRRTRGTRLLHIAQAHDGALVWVYRHRVPLPLAQPADEGWYLHGRYG